jgi:hypothetical protein
VTYRYIKIEPLSASLDDVLNDSSEYNKGASREMRLAKAAPDLLVALEACVTRLRFANRHIDCESELAVAENAINKARP